MSTTTRHERCQADEDLSTLERMTASQRLGAAQANRLSRHQLWVWATHFPDEVPLVNGELPWIALGLADID